MNDDDLADLLGEKPAAPDVRFRLDTLSRVAEHARRRAALNRAVRIVAGSTALGLFFGLTQAAGLTLSQLQPLFYLAIAVPFAYLMAMMAIRRPTALSTVRWRIR
jgi:hypothetical protein